MASSTDTLPTASADTGASGARAPWEELLAAGREDGRLMHSSLVAARAAAAVELPEGLHPELVAALGRIGVQRLYSHQHEALFAALQGHAMVTTGTASGKSLCFNLPVLQELANDRRARALYVYPTKALAQDQARALHALGLPWLRPAIYDGDTPREERAAIRRRANIVLTNPDMLHVGILPHHDAWAEFLARLVAVVVDEAHVYRGVFGSHVANVLRRLRRVAPPQVRFLMASATVANPGQLAESLTGLDSIALVERDGAPAAERRVAIWNAPLDDEALGTRGSVLAEAAGLLASLTRAGARTICFMRSRKAVELLVRMARERLSADEGERVVPYRAGYTPQQRRELEARLAGGELLAVVATDALELGIDIGTLDAAICVTFPGTVASLRQMWGRAGRRGRGLALYLAGEDALDQFFCRHPDELLGRPVEAAILDHASPPVLSSHLECAAYEAPLGGEDEGSLLGPGWRDGADELVRAGRLVYRRGRYVPARPEEFPAAAVSLRSASPDTVRIIDGGSGEVLGTVERSRAPSTVHTGAVYLHLGRRYEVLDLDLGAGSAVVEPFTGDFYTQPRSEASVGIEELLERRETLGVTLSFGRVSVSERVLAFQRRRVGDGSAIGLESLSLPASAFATQALWFELEIGEDGAGGVGVGGAPAGADGALLGALHAVEHSQIAVLPLLAMCDRWDIGGLSTNAHAQTLRPTIFIYDGHEGGVGIARRGYERFETLCADARRLIAECGCREGCPSCIQSPKCGNLNEPLSKAGALTVLGGELHRGA